LSEEDFSADISRRRPGAKGTTLRHETDLPLIESGCYKGRTSGTPLLLRFQNSDTRHGDYDAFIQQPRPGHADYIAGVKYFGCQDARGGGHFSGRITLGLVAAGVLAKKILAGVTFNSQLLGMGDGGNTDEAMTGAMAEGDSIGGVVSCRVTHLAAGLGEPFFDSLESLLAHVIFAIPGVRGVEFGDGFGAASMRGGEHNDVFVDEEGRTDTNHCGGINGGISNGNPLELKVAFKPTASIAREQLTWDFEQKKMAPLCIGGRHDICFALRAPVIVEAAVAVVLADLHLIRQSCLRGCFS